MIKQMPQDQAREEKRRFERITIGPAVEIPVLDTRDKQAGVLRQLARGGFAMETDRTFTKDTRIYDFTIHEPTEDIRFQVSARVRFCEPNLVGFEFVDLTPEAAVELGILIGKYYEHNKA